MVSHSPQVLGLSPGWLEYFQSMFQTASQGSPMTVTINGENVEDINNIEITQNAADEESPLTWYPFGHGRLIFSADACFATQMMMK